MEKDIEYKEIMDKIFSSFQENLKRDQSVLDFENRDPDIIFAIINKYNLVPEKDKVIRTVGSKGKGITINILKSFYKKYKKKKKVGTFTSPYKYTYLDQIKINGIRITKENFVKYYNFFKNDLKKAEEDLDLNEYLSPFSILLLIALMWFKDEGVEIFLLETGRGVKYDEVGRIPSKVSVFTSLSEEHLNYLGPTINDVFLNKITILENSDTVFVNENLKEYVDKNDLSNFNLKKIKYVENIDFSYKMPKWYRDNYSLASKAFSLMNPYTFMLGKLKNIETTNFGRFKFKNKKIYFDSGSNMDSLDSVFFDHLRKLYPDLIIILALDDRKDVISIAKFFYSLKFPVYFVILKNKFLKYDKIKNNFDGEILGEFVEKDVEKLENFIDSFSKSKMTFYFVGSNKFIRFLKKIKDSYEK